MNKLTVTVAGMSCGHCVSSVRSEVGQIPGVTAIDVDVASGTVVIDSTGPLEEAAIRTAVEEAGYRLAS
jgi:copper ion binding protein